MAARKATKRATKKAVKRQPKERPSIDDVVASINAEMKAEVVRRASEIDTLYLLRRPTGITSLDIALGGGFPASATSVIVGPDGVGKDYLLWKTCAETQRIYGEDFVMAAYLTEFRADKPFMRNVCGLKIAFSDSEIADYCEAREHNGLEPLTKEEKAELKTEVGKIYLIDGVTAEDGFDALIRLIQDNRCQIVAINSIGCLQTEAKEAVDSFSEFPQQRNEAMLLTKFMPKLSMTLNNDANGRNETSLIMLNQVRSKDGARARGRPLQEREKYEPGSKAGALKHGKAIEVLLHKGPKYRDEVDDSIVGREVPFEITKGKLGTHEGIRGKFDFFFDGGADVIGNLFDCCLAYEVFEVSGAWYSYEDDEFGFSRLQGKDKTRRHLMENPELVSHLKEKVLQAAGILYRLR